MNIGPLNWKIKKGDLVKARLGALYHEHLLGDNFSYKYGLVISDKIDNENDQLDIFPCVQVFIFSSGSILYMREPELEIISNA